MAELLYDIRLHEWAVPSPLTNGDKCQRRWAAVCYMATLSSSSPPSALQRRNHFRPELGENLKRCEACTLEGEAGCRKVNKAETKTVLAYFYERHGKMSLPIYVLLSRGWLFYFLASWSARWVGEGGGMEGEAVLCGRGKMDLQNTGDNIRISSWMHYDVGSKWEIKLSAVYYEARQHCPYAVQVNLTGWIIIQQTRLWYSNFKCILLFVFQD